MTFVEDSESEYKTKLSLWGTINGQVWIEMGPEQEDEMLMQGIALDLGDAKILANELVTIIKQLEQSNK